MSLCTKGMSNFVLKGPMGYGLVQPTLAIKSSRVSKFCDNKFMSNDVSVCFAILMLLYKFLL